MQSVDYIICGDYVLTMDEKLKAINKGAVAVGGKKIIDVDFADNVFKKYRSDNVIKGEGRAVLPGLVNTHTHAAMVYFRGLADDLPLKDWLEKYIWPAENRLLGPDFVHDAVELACLEMLKAGVTTYNDMYFYGESAAKASKKMGIRALIGAGIVDFPTVTAKTPDEYIENAGRFIEDWKGDDLITPCIAPHSAYACSPDTLKKVMRLAGRHEVLTTIHLAETEWEVSEINSKYGMRPVEHLDSIGFLNERALAVHCVWVDDKEIELLAKKRAGVSHCIESNLKLSSGIAPVPRMLAKGIKVSLGTDGAASNNDLNILSEMSTAAKVHKAAAGNPTILDSKTVLLMATRWGAEALGIWELTGSIEKGKLADIITIDLLKPHLAPVYDIYSHMVYSAMASDVDTVIVNGKMLINGGAPVSFSADDIIRKAYEWGSKIAL